MLIGDLLYTFKDKIKDLYDIEFDKSIMSSYIPLAIKTMSIDKYITDHRYENIELINKIFYIIHNKDINKYHIDSFYNFQKIIEDKGIQNLYIKERNGNKYRVIYKPRNFEKLYNDLQVELNLSKDYNIETFDEFLEMIRFENSYLTISKKITIAPKEFYSSLEEYLLGKKDINISDLKKYKYNKKELDNIYRKVSLILHPDKGGNEEKFNNMHNKYKELLKYT